MQICAERRSVLGEAGGPTLGVIVFHTTSAAIKADKVLRQTSFATKLVPTPRHLSSDCGLAIRFNWIDKDGVAATLAAQSVEISAIHPLAPKR